METKPCIWLIGDTPDESLKQLCAGRCTLLHREAENWNRDLSPWPAAALREGDEAFSGGADTFLRRISAELTGLEAALGLQPCWRGIIGYSLAGLFALYALTKSELFSRAASVSGSLWFEGWTDYLAATPLGAGKHIYLSLGSKEAKSGNPRMRSVADCTERTLALLQSRGAAATYVRNPGGHFTDPEGRMARAIDWLLQAEPL